MAALPPSCLPFPPGIVPQSPHLCYAPRMNCLPPCPLPKRRGDTIAGLHLPGTHRDAPVPSPPFLLGKGVGGLGSLLLTTPLTASPTVAPPPPPGPAAPPPPDRRPTLS